MLLRMLHIYVLKSKFAINNLLIKQKIIISKEKKIEHKKKNFD